MAVCVVIHATGVTTMLRRVRLPASGRPRPWRLIWLFIRLTGWIVFLHLMEIVVWAAYYVWQVAMPDFQTAAYFSAVTYTTTGYGDLVLSPEWRLVGSVEALTGILMCGWSTAFFFAIVSRIHTEARPLDSTP